MEGGLSVLSLSENALEKTSPYQLGNGSSWAVGQEGISWFPVETWSSWSSSLGLILLVFKGNTPLSPSEN